MTQTQQLQATAKENLAYRDADVNLKTAQHH